MIVFDRFVYAVPMSHDTTGTSGRLRSAFGHVTARLLLPPDRALGAPRASDRDVWAQIDQATANEIVTRARADLGSPWPLPLAHTAAAFHHSGHRTDHEALVFTRQYRLSRAAIAAAVTLEAALIDEVADGVWQLCEQSTWCWPAHDDAHAMSGSVLPDVTRPFLDLGAGEVVAQLAWIDHLLGEQLDQAYPGLRQRIRHEARVRVFDPFLQRRDWHWLGLDGDVHNWNPWIHGNVIVAALRLLDGDDESETRARVVDLCVEGIDRFVAVLPADGATDEGYHYWWNGALRALEALDVLRVSSGGRLDAIAHVPALRATIGFPHRMHLGGAWVINAADGTARMSHEVAWEALFRLALQVGDTDAAAFAAAHRTPDEPAARAEAGLGRLILALTHHLWIAAAPAAPPLPRESWLESIQIRLVRARAGSSDGLTLVMKGGHNDEHHNHNDVGEVIVASDGVPVLVDAGRPTYTAKTFGPRRYEIRTMQSGWHNVPLVRGTEQSPGREFRASDVTVLPDGLALDLVHAYSVPELASWRRTARLEGDAVVIADRWDLEPWEGPGNEPATTLHFLVAGDLELTGDCADVTPLDGASPVTMTWPTDVLASTTVWDLDDPVLSDVWGPTLTRLELDVTARREIAVVITQRKAP